MNKKYYLFEEVKNSDSLFVFFNSLHKFKSLNDLDNNYRFEFYNYTKKNYSSVNRLFLADYLNKWYTQGFFDKPTSCYKCCEFLKSFIKKYKKVVFVGVSAGGYAAILYGSLLNVHAIISFIPQTNLYNIIGLYNKDKIGQSDLEKHQVNPLHMNLANVINNTTKIIMYGDETKINPKHIHSIHQLYNLKKFKKVEIRREIEYNTYFNICKTEKYFNKIFDSVL